MNVSAKSLLASASLLILTMVHHVYGAYIYDTPWRLHVVHIALPVLAVLIVLHALSRRWAATRKGKITLWLFMGLSLFMTGLWFGLYEGGYNHLLKNILYFAGMSLDIMTVLYPPRIYEMPNDFIFESTGILQFFIGVFVIYYTVKLWPERN
jgi:uncharacterized membrane protein